MKYDEYVMSQVKYFITTDKTHKELHYYLVWTLKKNIASCFINLYQTVHELLLFPVQGQWKFHCKQEYTVRITHDAMGDQQ